MKTNAHLSSYLARFFLKWKMLQTEVVEIKLTFHAKTLFFKSHGIYEIMWKKYCRDGKATDETMALGFARWLPKATYKHSEYIIQIAFSLQQWWHELVSMLRCTYIVCLALLPLYIQHAKHIYYYDSKLKALF